MNSLHPASGLPLWRHSANEEINANPKLDKAGQMTVMEKHQTAGQGPLLTPQYGEQINENLTAGQRAIEYGVAGATGFANAGLAPFKAFAPHTVNAIVHASQGAVSSATGQNAADDALYAYQPDSTGNTIARGVGAAIPMALTGGVAGGSRLAAAAILGGLSGAGGARDEVDQMRARGIPVTGAQEFAGAAGEGVLGAAQGAAQGKLMGIAGGISSRVANPLLRGATAAGVDAAGNAAFGAAGHIAGNVIAQSYDPGRPIFAGAGDAAIAGAAGGLLFAPSSIGHANTARTINHIGGVIGASDVRLADNPPQGRAALAAKYIGQAVGRKVVWFESESKVQAFPDADGKTIYANAKSPAEALPAILAHEAIGHVAKDPAVAAQLESLRQQYPQAQATAEQEYLRDLEAGGFAAKAQQLRDDPAALREEGTAKFIEEAINGDKALADEIAGRYPGLFARIGRSVTETVDKIAGGNKQKARLVREQLGLAGDVFANAEGAAKRLAAAPIAREEGMLDRLDPQLTDAARADQAAAEQRSAALADDGRQRLAARDLIHEEQQTRDENAEVDQRVAEQHRRARQEDLAALEGEDMRQHDRMEADRRAVEMENRHVASLPADVEPTPQRHYAHDELRALPDDRLQQVARENGVAFDARSTTVPRILDAQQRRHLEGLSDKELWDTVRGMGLRAGTRQQNVETLMGQGSPRPQLSKPTENDASVVEPKPATEPTPPPIPERTAEPQANSPPPAERQPPAAGASSSAKPPEIIPNPIQEKYSDAPKSSGGNGYKLNTLSPPPPAKRESGPRPPKGFTRAELDERLLAHHRELNGNGDLNRSADLQQDSGTDLLGPSKFTFHGQLPGEVKSFLEGRPEARRLFRVTQDAADGGRGADVMHAMEKQKPGSYFDMAERAARGRTGELADAKQTASASSDPTMQFYAKVHDALTGPASERKPFEAKTPGELPLGTRFEFQGEPFRVVEDENGVRILRDHGNYPELPIDWLDKVPVDKGSIETPKSKDVNDIFTSHALTSDAGVFGQEIPRPATGNKQGGLFHEPVSVAGPAEDAADARIRGKFSQGEAATGKLFANENTPPTATGPGAVDAKATRQTPAPPDGEAAPGGPVVGEETIKGGRTSFEVSGTSGDKLTVEQERPGGKSWRIVRKGMTVGEVSRPTAKVIGGGLSRAEATAEASRIVGKTKPPIKPGESHDMRDLPNDEIPFSIAPAKPGEEEKPAPPVLRSAVDAVRSTANDVRRWFTIHPVPRLTEAGVGDAAIEHASAKIATPKIVDDLISKVLPDSYRDEKATAALADVLLKNRYLGAWDHADKMATEYAAQAHEATPGRSDVLAGRAQEYRNRAAAIKQAHNLPNYNADVVAALKNPETKAAIDRYQEHVSQWLDGLYQEVKGAGEEPGFRAPKQGRHFDAYLPIIGEIEGPGAAQVQNADEFLPANNTMNAKVRKDRFDRRADYTGTFDTDLHALLSAVVGPRWNEATKLRFYKSLIASGAAVESGKDIDVPKEIQGKPVQALDVKMPRFDPETGQTTHPDKKLFLRADLHREVRDALNTDQRSPQSPIAKALTTVQLFQLADAVTHAKNIASRVYMSQGAGSRLWDVVKANPAVGIPRTAAKMYQAWREVSADGPGIRAEIADMAKQGMIRGHFDQVGLLDKIGERTGWDWVKNLSTGDMLHSMDTAARVILNRQYTELVSQGRAEDSVTSRRNFVNTVGQYNHRLMGDLMRRAREAGISPFVVAGRTYNKNAVDIVTGNPQFKAPSTAEQRNARLTQLGMLASIAITAPLVNMITTGTPGGRSGTPLGAIDLGGDDTDGDGNHKVWDVLQLAGIRRGLRATGLDALGEGLSQGKDANTIGGNAFANFAQSGLHPWLGPAVGFGFKALTGRQLDIRGKMDAATIPEGGAKQYLENLRAAVESQNPLVYALTRPAFQAAGLDQKPADEESSYLAGILGTAAKSPLGAAGVKDVRPGKDAAEELADRLAKLRYGGASMSPEDDAKFTLRRSLTSKLKSDPAAGEAAIEQAVEDGKLSEQQAANIHRKAGSSPFAWNVKSLSGVDAAKVYAAGSDEQKDQIRDLVIDKLTRSKELSPEQQDAKLEELGIEPPPDLAMKRELHELGTKARDYADAKKKVLAGDRGARAELTKNRLSDREQARLQRLQTISRAIGKAKKEGGPAARAKVRRLVAAA